jgi:hypothetical protein
MKTISIISILALIYSLPIDAKERVFPSLEPSVAIAKTWWQEHTNVWTPIGWPNNYMRFVVLYNGSLLLDPGGSFFKRPHGHQFMGNDFMLSFHTTPNGLPSPLPKEPIDIRNIDFGYGIQGWYKDHETPVLWTEFKIQSGLIVRAEMFSHQQGSSDVETALEPIYTWIRLKVMFADPIRSPDFYPIVVQLSRIFYEKDGEAYNTVSNQPSFKILVKPNLAPYKKALYGELYKNNGLYGMYVIEPDGRIRIGVQPTEQGRVSFFEVSEGVSAIKVMLKGEVGDYVDLLVPMFPQEKELFAEEQVLTYDGALSASDSYWTHQIPETAATFHVPEKYVTEAIERNLKFTPVIAEKDHITGEYSYLTGVWGYDALWPTPTSTVSHMLADQFGYHNYTSLYSEIFMQNQGTIKPPGKNYYLHPGYYGAPKTLTSFDWLADHGAILLQIATSGVLSGNKKYIGHWIPSILAACDFIKDMCAVTDHDGVKGLLPPAVSSDEIIETQAIWNIAWNYKGLTQAVKLLKIINHPRAKEFSDFADQTKAIFQKAYREFSEQGKRWTDDEGRQRYLPPTTLSAGEQPYHPFSDAFYLDTGPLILVWAGLMDADDPIMIDMVDFFRSGPNKKYYTPIYNCIWRPSLQHEMSTCEPCYSWNIFHSWQLGDRQRFLEGMYSLFVGALSQNTYISCEHRHGIHGNLFVGPIASYLAKLAVVDDQITEGELHLLRLCPQAWVSSEEESIIENIPTEYGQINLRFCKSKDGKTLYLTFSPRWRDKVPKVILFPVIGIEKIVVNNRIYDSTDRIVL